MQTHVQSFIVASVILVAVVPAAQARNAASLPIVLEVDITDLAHRVFRAHETMPVAPGPLTLYYPKWLPGEHAPSGPIANVAGLQFTVGGKQVSWRRDPLDMYAFHLDIPAGASALDVDLDFLSPESGGHFTGGVSVTLSLVDLNWNEVLLYPRGAASAKITFLPRLIVAPGWHFASALEVGGVSGQRIEFKPVPLNTLVDSPVIAGEHFKRIDLSPGTSLAEHLNIVGDDARALDIGAGEVEHVRALMRQAKLLFGSHHYRHYDFLLTLSDQVPNFGLEHHQSSDDRVPEESLTDPKRILLAATIMPHEFTHSWNGKFRRPAGLWRPDFQEPEETGMLWVYEGLTEYLGNLVLTARSGMRTLEQSREFLANIADTESHRPGSAWRSLRDASDSAQILFGSSAPWPSWRRTSGDFYMSGALLWLSVDSKIRELSHDRRSLDDFCRAFFGTDDGSMVTRTYTFQDLVEALKRVQPYDWATYLNTRLDDHADDVRDELAGSGWKLIYTHEPTALQAAADSVGESRDHTTDIGLQVGNDGEIGEVLWESPAYQAGVAPGMKLVAVNGHQFSQDSLSRAIAATQGGQPLALLIQDQDLIEIHTITYRGGLKYPHLEREAGRPDYLDEILAPRREP